MARARQPQLTLKIYAHVLGEDTHVLGEEQDGAAIARLDAIDASPTTDGQHQHRLGEPTRDTSGPSI